MSSLYNSSDYDHHEYGEYPLDTEEFLEQYDTFILSQARKNVFDTRKLFHPDVLDMEIDDLAQKTRIKLWQARQKQQIEKPKAYISRIAHNESVSMIRQHKPVSSLPLDEDGELYQGNFIGTFGREIPDPLYELEQKESDLLSLDTTIDAISTLPQCQQHAMICSLKEKVDDLLTFLDICREHNIDAETIHRPGSSDEVQAQRSSMTVARKKLRPRLRPCLLALY